MFIVGEPSERPPQGTGGKKLLIEAAEAKEFLDTIVGMPVNAKIQLDDHVTRLKVGVITAAKIEGNRFNVSGHLFDKDFPREVNAIRLAVARNEAGMSLETTKTQLQDFIFNGEVVAKAVSLVFTGAAILLKKNAAYGGKTDLAANSEEKERRLLMELKDLLSAITGLETKLTAKVDNAMEAIKKEVETKIAAVSATTAVKPGDEKKGDPSADVKALTAAIADLTKKVDEIKAGTVDKDTVPKEVEAWLKASGMKLVVEKGEKKDDKADPPARKTLTPELLARFSIKEGEEGATRAEVAAAIDKAGKEAGLTGTQMMAMKLVALKESAAK